MSDTRNTKPRRGVGRPQGAGIKLTEAVQAVIVDAIRCGNYLETAAACAGIHRDTLYEWLRKGAAAPEGDCYRDFSDMLTRAMAASEGVAIEAIRLAGKEHEVTRTRTTVKPLLNNGRQLTDDDGKPIYVEETVTETTVETDWRALAWLLERRFSRRWGRREYLETTVTEKPVEEMTDNEIDAELNEILEKCNEE